MKGDLEKLFVQLVNLKPILPGSISEQYNVCGKANCRCKDKVNPRKHGPQSRLSYTLPGKNSNIVIKKADVAIAQSMTNNLNKMRQLISAISSEAIRIYREEGAKSAQDQMEAAISCAKPKLSGARVGISNLVELEISRGKWKEKAQERIGEIRKSRVTIRNLTDSREKWRTEALSSRKKSEELKNLKQAMKKVVAEQSDTIAQLQDELKKKP
jgi:hypothetical protein